MTAAAAGGGLAAGLVSTRVVALADGVGKALFLGKLQAAGGLLALVLLAGGGLLGFRALSADPAATIPTAPREERTITELPSASEMVPVVKAAAAPSARKGDSTSEAGGQAPVLPDAARKFFTVDLQPKANQQLTDGFGSGNAGNNLAELPRGEQTFGGTRFQIGPGMLQLNSKRLKVQTTSAIRGIQLGHTFARLHVLHATCFGNSKVVEDGTVIGVYRLVYADSSSVEFPIVYGQDVRDFWNDGKAEEVTRGRVVWTGDNDFARQSNNRIRLLLTSWDNPHPRQSPNRIEFIKHNDTPAAPFCVAITVEKE
jgi:hypothetical protein